jgi:hypothetical protein
MFTRHFAVILLVLAVLTNVAIADNGPEHQAAQTRPIKLGTSGGNINDRSSMYCCSGTLGALVVDGSAKYILGNNHVLARSNLANPGEPINQPGQIDQNCAQTGVVAYLTDYVRIRFKKGRSIPQNTVDAAIAEVVDGAVDPNGFILDIGELGTDTLAPEVGLAVKKSGRTSGFTTGAITAVGVTVDVGYSRECGGASNQVARFKDQIMISSQAGSFSTGGDSGSIIVEDVANSPRPVGLLFAGSTNYTIANPIDAVLNAFGVALPGGSLPDPNNIDTGSITGTLTSSSGGAAIAGASVTTDTGESATTDASGNYTISLVPVGDRQVTASADGFNSKNATAQVTKDQTTTVNFSLKPSKGRGGGGKPKKNSRAEKVLAALRIKARHENRLFAVPVAVGHGVGLAKDGSPVIEIYLKAESAQARQKAPAKLDNIPVRLKVTGPIVAF